jgi:hypothetical protein
MSRASARTNVADVDFCAALSTMARSGSHAERSVMVPTLDEAKSGVYRKCGRGGTMTISLFCEATLRKAD